MRPWGRKESDTAEGLHFTLVACGSRNQQFTYRKGVQTNPESMEYNLVLIESNS